MKLERQGEQARFEDRAVSVDLVLGPDGPKLKAVRRAAAAIDGHEVRGDRIVVLAALLEGVLKTVNPVSSALGT